MGIRLSIFKRIIIIVSIVFLCIAIRKGIVILSKKNDINNDKKTSINILEQEIEDEKKRLDGVKSSQSSEMTDKDYEVLAREELGLIKRNEIIVKPKK